MRAHNYIYILLLIAVSMVFIFYGNIVYMKMNRLLLLPKKFPPVKIEGKVNTVKFDDFDERIWIHMVNNCERMKHFQDKYKGIEMDVIYNIKDSIFYVSHDSVPLSYLSLDELFNSVKNIENHYFWLDFKNLNETNYKMALICLTVLIEKHGVKSSNIIVESKKPYLLTNYTKMGFRTSFYLPIFNPYSASDEEIIQYVNVINDLLLKSDVNYLSGDYLIYQLVKSYFPNTQILLWSINKNNKNSPALKKILKDDNVKIILRDEL